MINNQDININKNIINIVWDINKSFSIQIKQDTDSDIIKLSCLEQDNCILEQDKHINEYSLTRKEFNKFLTINDPSIEEELFIHTFKILESFNNDSSQENKQLSLKVKPSLVSISNFFSIDNTEYELNSAILPSAHPTQNMIINLLFYLDNNKKISICNKYYSTKEYNEPQELIKQRSKLEIFKEYDPIIDHFFNKTVKMNNSFSTVENE